GQALARVAPAARLAAELAGGLAGLGDPTARRARRVRLEPFGAIVQLVAPRALVFVDRDRARSLGVAPAAGAAGIWRDPADDGQVGRSVLSAPLEAHLQLTNRCDAGCRGCYTGATPRGGPGEWDAEAWKRAIDELADMG